MAQRNKHNALLFLFDWLVMMKMKLPINLHVVRWDNVEVSDCFTKL